MKIAQVSGKLLERPTPRDERGGRLDGLEEWPRERSDPNMERIGQ